MAEDVADVVRGPVCLLARVSGRGVGQRQQRGHGHGGAVAGHCCGDLWEQRGEAEIGQVRRDARRVGHGHGGHLGQQGEAGLAEAHGAWGGQDGAEAVVEGCGASLVATGAGEHLIGEVLQWDVAGQAGVGRRGIGRVE